MFIFCIWSCFPSGNLCIYYFLILSFQFIRSPSFVFIVASQGDIDIYKTEQKQNKPQCIIIKSTLTLCCGLKIFVDEQQQRKLLAKKDTLSQHRWPYSTWMLNWTHKFCWRSCEWCLLQINIIIVIIYNFETVLTYWTNIIFRGMYNLIQVLCIYEQIKYTTFCLSLLFYSSLTQFIVFGTVFCIYFIHNISLKCMLYFRYFDVQC